MSKSAEARMDRQQDQAEAERLLCTIVIADNNGNLSCGTEQARLWRCGECATCRAWKQAREYVRAIQAGRETAGKAVE
jgi:hypothetical protein